MIRIEINNNKTVLNLDITSKIYIYNILIYFLNN